MFITLHSWVFKTADYFGTLVRYLGNRLRCDTPTSPAVILVLQLVRAPLVCLSISLPSTVGPNVSSRWKVLGERVMDTFLKFVLAVHRLPALNLEFEHVNRVLIPSVLDGSFAVQSRLLPTSLPASVSGSGQSALFAFELPLRFILEHVAHSLSQRPPLSSPLVTLFVLRAAHHHISNSM